MEDAVRPNEQAFKTMYERGYCTWLSLYEMIIADNETNFPWSYSPYSPENAFRDYPSFPENLAVDASISNTVLVKGISTWRSGQDSCDQSFDQEFSIPIASDFPTTLTLSDPENSAFVFLRCVYGDNNHISLLVLAWTYILSARWAEIIPGASGPKYNNREAEWDDETAPPERETPNFTTTIIDLGDVGDDAARWWSAVLALDTGWNTSIQNKKGRILHSPWYTKLVSDQRFILSRGTKSRPIQAENRSASFATALEYLNSYCELHKVVEQCYAALAAALLIPVAKFDNRTVQLPIPRVRRRERSNKETVDKNLVWSRNIKYLDKLLALSCNAVGTKALLTSIFFEPGVECNICGAWLQGSFAFLDSDTMQDQNLLLRVLMKRDPSLGFLWIGAFILGAQVRSLQEARQAWWKIDLHVAAWTGTLMSFIQEPVSRLAPDSEEVSRADECRLLYLSHDVSYTNPPLFPFGPFGSTAMKDVNIDVRQHARCEASHSLAYGGLTWLCRGGKCVANNFLQIPLRGKNGRPTIDKISVNYDKLENEDDDSSEMVTRNIFTWLRDDDGFPVAEKAIREHEWIDNLDSDDDSPITGDTYSAVGDNLHGWLMKTMTTRSHSL